MNLLKNFVALIFVVFTVHNVQLYEVSSNATENVFVISGQTLFLPCRSNSTSNCSKWHFITPGSAKPTQVFSGEKGVGKNFTRFKVPRKLSNDCELTISNATMEDAGIYECSVLHLNNIANFISVQNRYAITVIDSEIECGEISQNPVREGENFSMNCTIGFKGHLIPTLQWTKNGIKEAVDSKSVATFTTGKTSVTSSLKLKTDDTMNGALYSCSLQFPLVKNREENSVTVIGQTSGHTCISPVLNVAYGTRNLLLRMNGQAWNEEVVCVGDEMECSADGNPTPSYTWLIGVNETKHNENLLKVNRTLINMSVRCLASNLLSNSTSHAVYVIEFCHMRTDMNWTVVAICLAATVCVTVLFITISVYRKRSKGKRSGITVREKDEVLAPSDIVENQRPFEPERRTSTPSREETMTDVDVKVEYIAEMDRIETEGAAEESLYCNDYMQLGVREISHSIVYSNLQSSRAKDAEMHEEEKTTDYANISIQ